MRLGRYGRLIPETPQEVLEHPLWRADPMRLGWWLEDAYAPSVAADLWARASLLDGAGTAQEEEC